MQLKKCSKFRFVRLFSLQVFFKKKQQNDRRLFHESFHLNGNIQLFCSNNDKLAGKDILRIASYPWK